MLNKMLDSLRFALFVLLAVIGLMIYQAWEKDHPQPQEPVVTTTQNEHMPAIPATQAAQAVTSQTATTTSATTPALPPADGKLVTVKTDLLEVTINTQGGDIVGVNLLDYPESRGSSSPFVLLNNDPKTRYIAESGLLSNIGPDTAKGQAVYSVAQDHYELGAGQNDLVVKLEWKNDQGVAVTKFFNFKRDSYDIHVSYEINNHSSQPWQGSLYTQLMRTDSPPANHGGLMNLATYFGAAISSPQKTYDKISFKQMREKNIDQSIQGGWAAMIQHYFIGAWIPAQNSTSTYYSKVTPDGLFTLGMIGQPVTVAPGATSTVTANLYTGPAIADRLETAAPNLKLTIDYGWFWFISVIIFWMMEKIHYVVGNWGWSIVLVTIVIKLMFYQLSAKSYRSMSGLKKLQPRIEALKQRYGDDRQKLTQATLALYREEKVNPMGGCLPILVQIPVFIALYWVLVESVQLRHAPFIFWIHDLSQPDPYYVLPVLMGISMFLQQRLNPPPPDPVQAKIMMFMPVLFSVMFANFPSGLMLYWVVNNTLSYLQQWHIMRRLDKEPKRIK